MSTTSTALITAEELMELPRGEFRHELINGELITMPLPGTPHGRIGARLLAPLAQFVWEHDLGEIYAEAGFQLTVDPDTVLGPDVSFVSKERLQEAGEVKGYWPGPPDLAVEVVSPSDTRPKVREKTVRWFQHGTKQVWIVNPKDRTVMVHRSPSDVTTFQGSDYLEAQDILPGFRISLERIFSLNPGAGKG
jgi:Uma2 family endonuclease